MEKHESFIDSLNYRRSVRVYDDSREIEDDIVKKCIQQATLAPNSSNMQLWEFHHVTSKELVKELAVACLGQPAATTAKQMVVVVVRKDLWKQRAKSNLKNIQQLFANNLKEKQSSREKFALNYYGKLMPFVYGEFLGLFGYLKFLISWVTVIFRPTYRQLRQSDLRIVAHKSAALAAQTFMLGMAAEGYDTCPMEGSDTLRIKKILKLPLKTEINIVISCGIRKPEGIYGTRFRIPFEEVYKHW